MKNLKNACSVPGYILKFLKLLCHWIWGYVLAVMVSNMGIGFELLHVQNMPMRNEKLTFFQLFAWEK